jgi:hypothetical protein
MVYSLKLTFVANSNDQTGIGLTPVENIFFGSMEFTADHFDNLSLSPERNDSGTVFIGMVHNGSPSLHTGRKESFDEGGTTSSEGGGSSGFPDPRGRNVMTPTIPITTTPSPESP